MNSSRRLFLTGASLLAGSAVLENSFHPVFRPGRSKNGLQKGEGKLTLYNTNNINGNIKPVYKAAGGLGKIGAHLKNEDSHFLLLDAGGVLNTAHPLEEQRTTIALMNQTGYHAAGVTGLDLSGGDEKLAALMRSMQFTLVNCNHRFTPELKSFIKPYITFKSGPIKIGVTGVSTPLKGAVYFDAIERANRAAYFLKNDECCQLVICLSDLGPDRGENKPSDKMLAEASQHIDIIIGNDHGKLQNNNAVMRNRSKNEVVFSAASANGLTIGKTVITFNDDKQRQSITPGHIIPGKPAGQNFGAAFRELSLAQGAGHLS